MSKKAVVVRRGQEVLIKLKRPLRGSEEMSLVSIPGLTVKSPRRVVCPAHAKAYVIKVLKSWKIHGKAKTRWIKLASSPAKIAESAKSLSVDDIEGLNTDAVKWFSYQKRELPGLVARMGGLMQWVAGAGKTLTATAFSRLDTSEKPRTVVVTLSSTRQQWEATYRRFYSPEIAEKVEIVDGFWAFSVVPRPKPRITYFITDAHRVPVSKSMVQSRSMEDRFTADGAVKTLTKTQEAFWEKLVQAGGILPLTNAAGRALIKKGWAEQVEVTEEIPEDYLRIREKLPAKSKKLSTRLRALVKGGWIKAERKENREGWKPFEVRDERTRKIVSKWAGGEAPLPMRDEDKVQLGELCRVLRKGDQYYEITRARRLAARGHSPEAIRRKYPKVMGALMREWGRALAAQDVRQRSDAYRYPEHLDTLILSWDVLAKRLPSLLAWGVTTVIFDESQYAKSSKVWEAYFDENNERQYRPQRNMAGAAQVLAQSATRVLLLSATPQEDRVRDWWAQLSLIAPTQWGTFREFSSMWCDGHQGEYGWDSRGSSRLKMLNQFKRPWISRVTAKEARANLPPMRREFVRLRPQDLEPVGVTQSAWTEARASGSVALLELRLSLTARMKRPYVLDRALVSLGDGHKTAIFTGRTTDVEECAAAAEARLYPAWVKALAHSREKTTREAPELPPTILWAHGENGEMVKALPSGEIERVDGLSVPETRDLVVSEDKVLLVGSAGAWCTAIDGLQCMGQVYITMLARSPGPTEQLEGRFNRPTQPGQVPTPTMLTYIIAGGTVDDGILVSVLDKLRAVADTYEESGSEMDALRAVLAGDVTAESAVETWAAKLLAKYGEEDDPDEWVDL